MRIGIIADALDDQYAGIHIYTREIIRSLARLDKKNSYVIVRQKHGEQFDGMEELVIPTKGIPGHGAHRLFFQVPKMLRKAKVDAVIEPRHFGPFNLPKKIKRLTVIHDLTPVIMPHFHRFPSQLLQRTFLPFILSRADHVITNSAYTLSDIVQYYPDTKDKITAIHLGKEAIFKPKKDPSVLKKYHIHSPYFLFVGTIEPRKNLMTLLKAYEKFRENSAQNHQLVLVGKLGWQSNDVLKAIDQSPFKGDIIRAGYVDRVDLPVLYSMTEAFIYPSFYEGFGLPVLEAMACGAPCIVSNISSLPEVGGDAALYFDPQEFNGLLKQINNIVHDGQLQIQASKKSLEQAERFSWDRAGREMMALFDQLS